MYLKIRFSKLLNEVHLGYALILYDWCPFMKGNLDVEKDTQREQGGEETQGRQRQAEVTRSWAFAMEPSKRLRPCKHFIFGLLASRTRKRYVHSKLPTLWHFVSVALGKSSTSSKPLDYPVSTMLQGSPSYPCGASALLAPG